MKRTKIATALAVLLLVAGCGVAAEETPATKAATPTYGPGWRHEQMMQARANGQLPPAAIAGQRGPGMGYGMGRGGPPLRADGTIDTAQLPDWCPMKTALPQK